MKNKIKNYSIGVLGARINCKNQNIYICYQINNNCYQNDFMDKVRVLEYFTAFLYK
jgi:hypothetical protein